MAKHRYADATAAGSLASLKHYPGDFDHIDDKGRISPALSNRSGFTERLRLENQDGVSLKSFQGGVLQPWPSTHSLRSLGLTREGGPVVNGGHSRAPSQAGFVRQPSLHGLPAQGPVQGMMVVTPAVTPTPQHRPMPAMMGGAPLSLGGAPLPPPHGQEKKLRIRSKNYLLSNARYKNAFSLNMKYLSSILDSRRDKKESTLYV